MTAMPIESTQSIRLRQIAVVERSKRNKKGTKRYICISYGKLQRGPKMEGWFARFWINERLHTSAQGVIEAPTKFPGSTTACGIWNTAIKPTVSRLKGKIRKQRRSIKLKRNLLSPN